MLSIDGLEADELHYANMVDRTFLCFPLDIAGRVIGMTALDGRSLCMLSGPL